MSRLPSIMFDAALKSVIVLAVTCLVAVAIQDVKSAHNSTKSGNPQMRSSTVRTISTNLVERDPWRDPSQIRLSPSGAVAKSTASRARTDLAYLDPRGNSDKISLAMDGAFLPSDSAQGAKLDSIETSEASTNPLEFGPENEKVLDTRGALGARVYLSFEQGTVAEETSTENPQRNHDLHRDLKLHSIEGELEWTGVELKMAPATEEQWNAPANDVIATLSGYLAPPLPSMQIVPGVWFFKTREGVCGLMRVVGFVEPRPGEKAMKLVYKLAKPVTSKKQA
jgi:hypothetical protein